MSQTVQGDEWLTSLETPAAEPRRSPRIGDLGALFCAALLERLVWSRFWAWESGDGPEYLRLARNIAVHHVFSFEGGIPTAYRPPLYPVVIALLWHGGAAPTATVVILQAFLGAATVVLTYLVALDYFDRRVALLSAVLMTLAPMNIHYVATVLTETLFTFLVMLGVFFWGRKRYVLTGVTFGLATLTRSTLLPFLFLIPVLAMLPGKRALLRAHMIVLLVALLPVGTWIGRNALVLGRFIPVVSWGVGANLYLGTIEMRLGASAMTQVLNDPAARQYLEAPVPWDPPALDRQAILGAVQRIRENPVRWLRARLSQYPRLFIDPGEYLLVGSNQVTFFDAWRTKNVRVLFHKVAFSVGNVLVFVLAATGVYVERARLLGLAHIWLFPAFLMAVYLPMYVEARYGLPMMPMVFVFAANGAIHARRPGQPIFPAGIAGRTTSAAGRGTGPT